MAEVMGEVGKTDFEFYAKFAKPLILTLNCTEDRILAASWFSKLRDVASGPDKLRLDYLKLLLFVLQRHRLAGPFTENPNAKEELEEFDEDYDLAAVARQIIEKEQKEVKERYLKRIRGEVGDWPPFSTDYSPDLREYVAAQDIPNFGVHVYYAISKDPILDWDNSEHAVFPRAVRRMEPQGHISETSFAVMEPRPETPDEDEKCKILEETGVMPDESIFMGRKSRQRKSPFELVERPAPPLGILPGEGEGDLMEDELPPPTWGSNLIEVREPIDLEGPETPPPEEAVSPGVSAADVSVRPSDRSIRELDAEDPEVIQLLETSFNMEDILAEVDAMETEEPPVRPGEEPEIDPLILEEQQKFREMEADLDRHDAMIAEALATLDDDERRMLAEMEAEEAVGMEPSPKPSPKMEVKLVADDDTVIKVMLEKPEAVVETKEEKERKDAAADKKKKPAGRTGLNKGKAKGALLKKSEKKELEEQEKNAKVVETKTGLPSKRPGVPKPKTSKAKVTAAASEGEIPSEKPSKTDRGKAIPGKGIPRKGGIPRKAAGKKPEGTVEMQEMKERLEKKLQETKEAFPDKFVAEQAGPSGIPQAALVEEEGGRAGGPVDEVTNFVTAGSPESDDIYDEMEREYQILERLYELYEQLAPDRPDALRTPPVFSKHPEIRRLGEQLRYRADEFDIRPMEKFQPAEQYFAGEGAAAPSPFLDPRLVPRTAQPPGVAVSEGSIPETVPSAQGITVETPPWATIEALKKIANQADRSLESSPAISAKVGMTTPKSPSTPRRPVRRDLRFDFDAESPPPYESPPPSPPKMETPEYLRDPGYFLPEVLTQEKVEQMYAYKQAEYDAYIQSEMEAERALWPILQPKPPTPRAPSPQMVSPRTPTGPPPPRPRTPPSVGGPGVELRTPGTPQGLPPSMRFQYTTPPSLKRQAIEVPGSPEFEEFHPLEHEDIIYQTMPELVPPDPEDYVDVVEFEGLHDWRYPMEEMLAAEDEGYMMFDASQEMTDIDLVPAEEDYAQFSPVITLQQRLMAHEIPKDFYDPDRPKARSKQVTIGSTKVELARRSQPTQLARQVIEEDLSGEQFEEYEDMINAEELDFLNISLGDPDRTEHLKKMADEAQDVPALFDEEPPELLEEMEISYGPPTPPPPPSPPPATPPMAPGRFHLLYGSPDVTPEDLFMEGEEPEFLASPGMPTPPRPPRPPTPEATPPWEPPPEAYWADDIFGQEDESFLASPGMPERKTQQEILREEVPSPVRLGPSAWELPTPPRRPVSPVGRPLGPGEIQVSPQQAMGRGVPSPRMAARPVSPYGTPEMDPMALRRELMRHRLDFARKDQGFQAGQQMIQRRMPMPRPYFPIGEYADYEESKKLYSEQPDDYREMLRGLPPAPPPGPYPEELMGYEHEGRFPHHETLLDQPLPPIENLPSPLAPQRTLFGWQTPPHQKIGPMPPHPFRSPTPPRQPDIFQQMAPHVRSQMPREDEGFMGLREEDVFPAELLGDVSYGSPMVPSALMAPGPTPPSLAIPTMTMDQQMSQAEQRAQWQAQQITERTPSRPTSPARTPTERRPPAPCMPRQAPCMPKPPPQPEPKKMPCSRPDTTPKLLKRVKETSFSSEVYDPDSPENSRRWTKGKTMLEFNRPEEGDQRGPVVTPPSQGVAVYPRGPPISAPVSPAAMPRAMPFFGMPMPMPRQRPARMPRIPRPTAAGATPRAPGGMLPRRNILAGEPGGAPLRRRLFDQGPPQQPQGPSPPKRVCPASPKGEKIEIVEEFEETELDYIPEHLRGFRWMDEPEADPYYVQFRQQFS